MSKLSRLESWLEETNRHPRIWLAVLAALMALQISPWLYPTVDGCLYLKTAREFLAVHSLADFRCFVPPGYPALITPAFLFGERPFLVVSILQWLLSLVMMGGVYVWARRQFPAVAVLLTSAVMVNISIWTYYRRPTKEIATLAVLMWTVNLMHRLLDERRVGRIVTLTLFAALLTAYVSLMRYTAITLTVGFGLAAAWLAWRNAMSWPRAVSMSAAIGLVTAGTLAGWLYYDRVYGAGGIYLQEVMSVYQQHPNSDGQAGGSSQGPGDGVEMADAGSESAGGPILHRVARIALRFLHGMEFRLNDIGCLCVPGLWKSSIEPGQLPGAPQIAFLGLAGLLAFGWWKIVRRKLDVLALMFPVYFLLYSHWVCDQPGGRFMLPMLPIIVACAWQGLGSLTRHRAVVFGSLIAVHLAQSGGYWLMVDAPRAYQTHKNWSHVDRLANQIRNQEGEVAVSSAVEQGCHGLWLELDWVSPLRSLEMQFGPKVVWVVEPAGIAPPRDFDIEQIEGPFQLARRNSHPKTAQAEPRRDPSAPETLAENL